MVIMYKYHYDNYPYIRHIHWLITIVLNTLKAHRHKCKLGHESVLSPLPSRSRDFSTPSADIENLQDRDPTYEMGTIQDDVMKPFIGSGIKLKGFGTKFGSMEKGDDLVLEQHQKSKEKGDRHQWKSWKASDRSCSSEGEDAEPELEAIPESPKSESSEHERHPSELADLSQTLEQACVRLVKESYPVEDHVVVTDPWSKMANEATLVLNTENVSHGSYQDLLDRCDESFPFDVDSSLIIEKAAVETMEKHISKSHSLRDSVEFSNQPKHSHCELPIHSSGIDHSNFALSYLKNQNSAETSQTVPAQSLKLQAESIPEKDFEGFGYFGLQNKQNSSLSQPVGSISAGDEGSKSSHFQKQKQSKFTTSHSFSGTKYSGDILDSTLLQCENTSSNKRQLETLSLFKNKNDLSSLKLPERDCGSKLPYSKYPKSKLFQSKKKEQAKVMRKADMLASDSLTVPLFRPPLERLLPIGLSEREKAKKFEPPSSFTPSMMFYPLSQQHNKTIPGQKHDQALSHDTTVSTIRDTFEDKGVQTGSGGLSFDIPAQERLLPVGPPPSRKDWYTTSVFKTSFGEFSEEDKTFIYPETLIATPDNKASLFEQSEPVQSDQKICTQLSSDFKQSKNSTVLELHGNKCNVDNFPPTADILFKNDEKVSHPGEIPIDSASVSQSTSHNFNEANIGAENYAANENIDQNSKFSDAFSPGPVETVSSFGIFDGLKSNLSRHYELHKLQEKVADNIEPQHRSGSVELLSGERTDIVGFFPDFDSCLKHTDKASEDEQKCKVNPRFRKQRKPGLSVLEPQRSFDYQNTGYRRSRKAEMSSMSSMALTSKRSSTSQSSSARFMDDIVVERCTECGVILEEYSDEELGLCIVILATFVHREPTMAAPLLPKMLRVVARIASTASYPWQSESIVHLPGGSVSVARQFLRCTLHQLAPNGIFVQIFHSHSIEADFFKTMAAALADFTEVNQVTPLLMLFENLNDKKHLHHELVFHVLDNVATYLDCLPLESSMPPWLLFLQQLELFFRKFVFTLVPGPCQLNSVIHIILAALKMPVISNAKSILDPFSKILSHAIQHSALEYRQLSDICHYCNRNLSRERDKLVLTRTAIFELVQALKFKSSLPDANLLILVQFVLDDAGGSLGPSIIVEGFPNINESNMYNTSSSECMRQYLNDALEFVADVHTLNKVKNMLYGSCTHLNEETLGGQLKAGVAQYLAIEISKGNGRDNRAIGRYLPWLYHPPTTLQQGPKEFIDCVSHIRLLSWLLLGALIHSSLLQNTATFVCQPIPLEANSHIAEHIQVILAGFSEQSKVSVLHMSSLFHAFILCQLWSMYCEHMVALNPPGSEQNQICGLTLTEFWAKVTPGILQLVCHSKVLAEMVSLHFLSLMEALMECNSTVLARLLPMWTPVIYSFQGQLPGNLQLRLHACVSSQPPVHTREDVASVNTTFLRWLQRLQFKMGQIELQSSAATQFYSL